MSKTGSFATFIDFFFRYENDSCLNDNIQGYYHKILFVYILYINIFY